MLVFCFLFLQSGYYLEAEEDLKLDPLHLDDDYTDAVDQVCLTLHLRAFLDWDNVAVS